MTWPRRLAVRTPGFHPGNQGFDPPRGHKNLMTTLPKKKLACPLCGGDDFKKDQVVLPKYGLIRLTDYKVRALICNNCHYVLLFEEGNTFFLGVD